MKIQKNKSRKCADRRWVVMLACAPLAYILSSGPMLAGAFRLREATHCDGFYSVMWLYWPLLANYPLSYPFHAYVTWWCWLFGAVGPG